MPALFRTLLHLIRPRTLPLAVAAICCGNALAWHNHSSAWRTGVFILSLLTAVALQIVSNIANDYGDGIRGTDRLRAPDAPARLTARRQIEYRQIRRILAMAVAAAMLLGTALLAISLHSLHEWLMFLLLGGLAVFAALTYTIGRYAYGYYGLGEISVFLFFGLLGVQGSGYLQQGYWLPSGWLPATGCGLLAAAVLHINNIRDLNSDRQSGKNTLAVRLGLRHSKTLHSLLLAASLVCYGAYCRYAPTGILWVLALPLLACHLRRLYASDMPSQAGRELKSIVQLVFWINILFGMGLLLDTLLPDRIL